MASQERRASPMTNPELATVYPAVVQRPRGAVQEIRAFNPGALFIAAHYVAARTPDALQIEEDKCHTR